MLRVCLSVVSFNVTLPRAQSFIISYGTSGSDLPMRTVKFYSVFFGVMSRLSVINKIH